MMQTMLTRPALMVAVRIAWIVVRLLLVLWIGQGGTHFYYQGF